MEQPTHKKAPHSQASDTQNEANMTDAVSNEGRSSENSNTLHVEKLNSRELNSWKSSLAHHYTNVPTENGFASMCRMALPQNLRGKKVLDIGCRRGKGVYALSERVGASGWVIGIDPQESYIADAKAHSEHSWRKAGLSASNMEFRTGYPEDLVACGIKDASQDIVFTNSSINLAFDLQQALSEIYRVLAPGGLLIMDGTVAEGPRDPEVVKKARAMGNSVQASPDRSALTYVLREIGFINVTYADEGLLSPDAGNEPGKTVPLAKTSEDVMFIKTTLHTYKM